MITQEKIKDMKPKNNLFKTFMLKQIYTTGQEIQNELNRLYPKEHENFINDYVDFTDDERSEEWFIFDIAKLQGFINYIEKQGVEADCNGEQRDYFWEEFSTMCERVIKIMQIHGIDKVNILDKTERKLTLFDANVKDINDFNVRNTNFIEVKNYFCYLPERAKELINKHIEDDNCVNYYTEYTYDVGGKYLLHEALESVENALEEDDFESEDGKAFYTELQAVLKQITCEVIHY